MAVAFKAPVKDIVFGYEVVETYDVISKIPAFSDFNEDIVIPTMEECAKFAEEVLAPINAIGDKLHLIGWESLIKWRHCVRQRRSKGKRVKARLIESVVPSEEGT